MAHVAEHRLNDPESPAVLFASLATVDALTHSLTMRGSRQFREHGDLSARRGLWIAQALRSQLATAAGAERKGPVVKLIVTGPDLPSPIEITDPDAIDVNIYGATFADREGSKIENVPASPVPPYQVRFYVAMDSNDDVQMKYVVYYVWDSAERRARVYFPGRHDAWWRHNVFTVALPFEGDWYHATESWGRAVQQAIFEHNDPRILVSD